MNYCLERALKLAEEIDNIQIYDCSPSDDVEKQYAYSSAFRDIVIQFLGYVRRIQDPYLIDLLKGIDEDIDSGYINIAHFIKSRLNAVIDYLNDLKFNPEYKEIILMNDSFVALPIIQELQAIKSKKYDLKKLIKLIEELNSSYQTGNYLSSVLLLRAIINYIPPIFNYKSFDQVVSNSKRSIKAILSILEDGARPIADLHTHIMIRKKESIPSRNQIEPYKSALEVLLHEIIYELKSEIEGDNL